MDSDHAAMIIFSLRQLCRALYPQDAAQVDDIIAADRCSMCQQWRRNEL